MKKIVAIIPARGGSKGIPGKNIINFCGKPLIEWSIEQALGCKYIRDVYVSSNDTKILRVSEKDGAKIIKRPEEISSDYSSSEDALAHAIDQIENSKGEKIDVVVFLQATSPLRKSSDIEEAIEHFFSEEADSLFSASTLEDFCIWKCEKGELSSLNYNYQQRGVRQDRPPLFLENGSIYVFKPDVLRRFRNRLGGKIVMFNMEYWKSFEIDKTDDIEICEFYMKKRIIENQAGLFEKDLKLIVYDFDGVMTNNKALTYEDGKEAIIVNRSDGLAVSVIKDKGIHQLIISTESNKVVAARANKLGIPVLQNVSDKKECLVAYCEKNNYDLSETVYIGNDINDLGVMKIVGMPICPSDAHFEVKKISRVILTRKGGEGVIREFAEMIV